MELQQNHYGRQHVTKGDLEGDTESGNVLSEDSARDLEDAAEHNACMKNVREDEERATLARHSQVVQRGLPRPPNVDEALVAHFVINLLFEYCTINH
jgi:hypothetical protein